MSTNVEALKGLYSALGGSAEDVAAADTTVDVLNAVSAKYEGANDADSIADAISNITAVADNIGGGGSDITLADVNVVNSSNQSINIVGYEVKETAAGKTVTPTKTGQIGQNASSVVKTTYEYTNESSYGAWGFLKISFATAAAFTGKNITVENATANVATLTTNNGWLVFVQYDWTKVGVTPVITIS